MQNTTFAAVDLGSNSFHLMIVQVVDGEIQVVDKLKDRVRLAAGLDAAQRLSEESQWRALAVLRRFGQRLAEFNPQHVRVVGTNTLRKAINRVTFLAQAEEALGHPIEVISGQEEARLVYLGVTRNIEDQAGRRLVVDIGGGSTECVIGDGDELQRADSLYMGCVSYTQRFFPRGRITAKALEDAILAARLELRPVYRQYRELGWEVCYGSSGTINAIQTVLTDCDWCDHAISQAGLDKLGEALLSAGSVQALALPGLKPERQDVLVGGYAVLQGVFRALKIKRMEASKAALREGVIHDLMGRETRLDVRDRTVTRIQARFGVDTQQADLVAETALHLLAQAAAPWGLDQAEAARHLRWAAQLHEIGKVVAFSGHHKHGAYLVAHADMPGFSQGSQALLAALLMGHRRKYKRERLVELGVRRFAYIEKLTMLLRLAVSLTRTRSPGPTPGVVLTIEGDRIDLGFPERWLVARPLTRADLETEAHTFATLGWTLTWA
jgi:exopolyphosphatase/guanosine-5'-triphosphate,3'-diphosphate pyrophosphatase